MFFPNHGSCVDVRFDHTYLKPTEKTMNAKKKNTNVTLEWLTAKMGNGHRRIEALGWKRLAAIYAAAQPNSAIRKAINAEACRCGYTSKTILKINAE
jgi:hypothetical protein